MRADNSRHLITAARHRSEQTRQRAIAALRRLDATGQPISFDAVARQASVSRSRLYTQQDLRTEIQRLRQRHPAATPAPPPDRQRASELSLLRRLEAATARIRHLEADNQQLRDALARALGERRAAGTSRQTSRDTPKGNSSQPITRG
jgi:hypothetical protein